MHANSDCKWEGLSDMSVIPQNEEYLNQCNHPMKDKACKLLLITNQEV